MAKNISDGENSPIIEKLTCGIIMPISETLGYSPGHWSAVKSILDEIIIDAGYVPNLVSDADDVGIIHNRIVKNLAENNIVVCDVSSKNPNVMFELGLRLAFDKATIIIKDELTSYNFDTSPIEHLTYPSSLNYHTINDFKIRLKNKLLKTVEAAKDPNYSTFLKNFVTYKRDIKTEEISNQAFLEKQFEILNQRLRRIERQDQISHFTPKEDPLLSYTSNNMLKEATFKNLVKSLVDTYIKLNPLGLDLNTFPADDLSKQIFEWAKTKSPILEVSQARAMKYITLAVEEWMTDF